MSRSYSVSDTKFKSFNLAGKQSLQSNSQTIKYDEFQQMKKNSIVLSKDEQIKHSNHLDEVKEYKALQLQEKKQFMNSLYNEKKKEIPLSEDDQIRVAQREQAIQRVIRDKYEQNDHNKQMNKMVDYAKCVMVRDQQLVQKKQITQELKNKELSLEYTVEMGRLNNIKQSEDATVKRKIQYKNHLNDLLDQQQEKKQRKLAQKQTLLKENQEFLQQALDNKEQERQQNIQAKIKQNENNISLINENQKAVQFKALVAAKREEELKQIAQYNAEKVRKELEYQDYLKRLQDEKEKEIQRLRELQEKAGDKQADIDAIQARRATEAKERIAREKEQAQLEKKIRTEYELFNDRKKQQRDQVKQLEQQAKQEQEDFLKINKEIKNQKSQQDCINQKAKDFRYQNIDQIRKQILQKEEIKNQAARGVLEEGKLLRDEISNEIGALESIRQEKMNWYNQVGVEKKYQIELGKKKIAY